MLLVVCEPLCCSSVPLCSCLSSCLSLHHLWHFWTTFMVSGPQESSVSLRSQLRHQTLPCFWLQEQMLRCAILIIYLQYLLSEAGPWLGLCFGQLKNIGKNTMYFVCCSMMYFWGCQGIQVCFLYDWGMNQCLTPSSNVYFTYPFDYGPHSYSSYQDSCSSGKPSIFTLGQPLFFFSYNLSTVPHKASQSVKG